MQLARRSQEYLAWGSVGVIARNQDGVVSVLLLKSITGVTFPRIAEAMAIRERIMIGTCTSSPEDL